MTASKKSSLTKSKTRPPTQTLSSNWNRFEKFADEEDIPKPSYLKVAFSQCVTDIPTSIEKSAPSQVDNQNEQDSKFDTLLSAIQSINERMATNDTAI